MVCCLATKTMKLLPSLRQKKRYVVFEVISQKNIHAKAIMQAIHESFLRITGEIGTAIAGLYIPGNLFQEKTQKGIIRINNTMVDALRASFCRMTTILQQPVLVRSVGVSGTLEKAKKIVQKEDVW